MNRMILSTSLALAALVLASPALASVNTEQCDLLAASPLDPTRPADIPGVELTDIDPIEAEPFCRAAWAETGDPRYAFQLGRVLDMANENQSALLAYQTAVDGGHVAAQVNLGVLQEHIAIEEAAASDQWAADQGNLAGIYNLAARYRDGFGRDYDPQMAIKLFTQAAEGGFAWAAYDLALIYDEGLLVLEDDTLAVQFYEQAAAAGNAWAMVNLAHMFLEGDGVEVDLDRAAELFRMAYETGDINAGVSLALLLQHGSEAERAESLSLLIEALEARDLELGAFLVEAEGELTAESIEALERVLHEAGMLEAAPDGVADLETASAVRAFYAA